MSTSASPRSERGGHLVLLLQEQSVGGTPSVAMQLDARRGEHGARHVERAEVDLCGERRHGLERRRSRRGCRAALREPLSGRARGGRRRPRGPGGARSTWAASTGSQRSARARHWAAALASRGSTMVSSPATSRPSSSPSWARRSSPATSSTSPGRRTEWSRRMPSSHTGYQTASATFPTSRRSCTRTTSRSLKRAQLAAAVPADGHQGDAMEVAAGRRLEQAGQPLVGGVGQRPAEVVAVQVGPVDQFLAHGAERHGRRYHSTPGLPGRDDGAVGRQRSWWGWGYEDAALSDDDAAGLGALLGAANSVSTAPGAPPPVDRRAVVARPAPRRPGRTGGVLHHRPARPRHARYGKAYRDVVRALDGRLDHPPDVVARPRNEAEVAAVLDWCADADAAVIPYGGGSSVVGGVEPDVGDAYAGAVTIDLGALGAGARGGRRLGGRPDPGRRARPRARGPAAPARADAAAFPPELRVLDASAAGSPRVPAGTSPPAPPTSTTWSSRCGW